MSHIVTYIALDELKIKEIVEALLMDLQSRKGFDLSDIDVETLQEWREEWIDIVTMRTQPFLLAKIIKELK